MHLSFQGVLIEQSQTKAAKNDKCWVKIVMQMYFATEVYSF